MKDVGLKIKYEGFKEVAEWLKSKYASVAEIKEQSGMVEVVVSKDKLPELEKLEEKVIPVDDKVFD